MNSCRCLPGEWNNTLVPMIDILWGEHNHSHKHFVCSLQNKVDTQLETRIVSLTVTSSADAKCDKTEVIYCGVKFESNAVYQSYHQGFAFLDFP